MVAVALPAEASAARYGSRTLKVGARGGDVKQLQRYLGSAGHRVARDGDFGPRTLRGAPLTESELELRADGVATVREQRAIKLAVNDLGPGGAAYVPPPPPEKVVPGAKGSVTADGFAVPPASAPRVVRRVIAAGNVIAKEPYKWGGGHGRWDDDGYDCSGSVSYALHGAGLLDSPLVSGDFARWGDRARAAGSRSTPTPTTSTWWLRHPLRHERTLPDRLALDHGGPQLCRLRRDPPRRPLAVARVSRGQAPSHARARSRPGCRRRSGR